MATNPANPDDYATKGDLKIALEDMRASINRDVRNALDEAFERQNIGLNRRFDAVDARFDAVDARFDEVLAAIREKQE